MEDVTSVTHLVCTLMWKERCPCLLTRTLATGQTLQELGKGSALAGSTGMCSMCAFTPPSGAEHLLGVLAANREESPGSLLPRPAFSPQVR